MLLGARTRAQIGTTSTKQNAALACCMLNRQDERWERAWLAELDRRSAAIDRGEDKLEDWETVKTRLRAELELRAK